MKVHVDENGKLFINSREDLIEAYQRLETDGTALEFDQIVIDQSVAVMKIKLIGSTYEGAISGTVARGIWEFQQEIYRAVAATIHGSSSIRKLSKEDLEKYNLLFEISEGSTWITTCISKGLEFLGNCMKGMTSAEKIKLITTIAVIIGGSCVAEEIVDKVSHHFDRLLELEHAEKMQKLHNEELRIFNDSKNQDKVSMIWSENIQNGIKSIIKNTAPGSSVEVNGYTLDSEMVDRIKQKSPRTASDTDKLVEEFTITGQKNLDNGEYSFEIRSASGEFTAKTNTDTLTPEEIRRLREISAVDGTAKLTVELYILKDKYKDITITSFHEPIQNKRV